MFFGVKPIGIKHFSLFNQNMQFTATISFVQLRTVKKIVNTIFVKKTKIWLRVSNSR